MIRKRRIVAFDLDDTLFWYKDDETKIGVVDSNGNVDRWLSRAEYQDFELLDGYTYDYSHFVDADLFDRTANTVTSMVDRLIEIVDNDDERYEVAIVTARAKFDNMAKFSFALAKRGIDTAKVKILTCGDYADVYEVPHDRKKEAFRQLIADGEVELVKFYDDQPTNLRAFLELNVEYPTTELEAYLVYVDSTGNAKVSLYGESK